VIGVRSILQHIRIGSPGRSVGLLGLLVLLAPQLHAQDLCVIVNLANPVQKLTAQQVLKIFVGQAASFPNGSAALPIDLPPDASNPLAERTQFYRIIAHKELAEMAAYWARASFSGNRTPPYQVGSIKMAVDVVAINASAIAYVPTDAVDNKRVRCVYAFTP
jgi:hypothetical protein